jgi:hypothetical protein
VNVNVGEEFDPLDYIVYTATGMEGKVVVSGDYDTNIAGEYKIKYSLDTSADTTVEEELTLHVNN